MIHFHSFPHFACISLFFFSFKFNNFPFLVIQKRIQQKMLDIEVLALLHIYECVTVPIYLRIIFVLINQKQFFRRPFWRIFCMASILDLFYYLLTLLFYRFPLLPYFQSFYASLPESRWIGWVMFAAFLAIYLQYLLHFLICLNRFTGICYPFRHEKFWRRTSGFWLLFSFVFAFGLCFNRLFTVGKFAPLIASDPSKGYTPIPTRYDFYFTRQELITTILGTACALICVAINSVTLFLIIRHRGNQQQMQLQIQPHLGQNNYQTNAGNNRRMEIRLFFITLWTMFAQLLFNSFELLIYWILGAYLPVEYFTRNKDAYVYTLFSQIPWIIDIYTLSQPWAALILSTDLRLAAFPRIFKHRGSTTVGIVMVQSSAYSTPIVPTK